MLCEPLLMPPVGGWGREQRGALSREMTGSDCEKTGKCVVGYRYVVKIRVHFSSFSLSTNEQKPRPYRPGPRRGPRRGPGGSHSPALTSPSLQEPFRGEPGPGLGLRRRHSRGPGARPAVQQRLQHDAVLQLLQQELPVLRVQGQRLPGVAEGLRVRAQGRLGREGERAADTRA